MSNDKRDAATHELTEVLAFLASPYAEPGERWQDYMPPVTAAPKGWDKAGGK
jgi:hypothetical protein